MATRTARCGCGRVEVTVDGEPIHVVTCHCDFCQRRSGSVLVVNAQFAEDQVVAISGETKCYNGLEVDGVAVAVPGGINYHFCTTCGSTIHWDFDRSWEGPDFQGQRVFAIAVGNFDDPEFPTPTMEFFTTSRHHWVPPVPGADQL